MNNRIHKKLLRALVDNDREKYAEILEDVLREYPDIFYQHVMKMDGTIVIEKCEKNGCNYIISTDCLLAFGEIDKNLPPVKTIFTNKSYFGYFQKLEIYVKVRSFIDKERMKKIVVNLQPKNVRLGWTYHFLRSETGFHGENNDSNGFWFSKLIESSDNDIDVYIYHPYPNVSYEDEKRFRQFFLDMVKEILEKN